MFRVNFSVALALVAVVVLPCVLGAITRLDPVYKHQRRVGLNFQGSQFYDQILAAFHNPNDFFDNFFNVDGKPHDRGADYMLTDDIYQKPNPFYTNKIKDSGVKTGLRDHLYPVYTPHHNESHDHNHPVQETQSIDAYEQPPTAYDDKTHTYNAYLPPTSYNAYGPPSPPSSSSSSDYGMQPHSTYGPPSYSPTASYYPHTSYGPPTSPSSSSYPYPTAPQHFGSHEADQKSHEGFFLKLIKKFDLVLMSKILLKLIIFKKIIKFIAVICLLLFLPVLKKKFAAMSGDYNEDEDRKYKLLDSYSNVDFRVKEIANFALTAIEGFETYQIPWCVGDSEFYCRVQYMLDQVDFRFPGIKVLSLWFPQLTTTTLAPESDTTPTPNTGSEESMEVHFNDYITDDEKATSFENANVDDEDGEQ